MAVLISLSCWFVSYRLLGSPTEYQVLGQTFQVAPEISYPVGFALSVIIGLQLIWMNKAYVIIRERTMSHFSLFLLLMACCPPLHPASAGLVATPFFLLSLHLLMQSFQETDSQRILFYAFLSLGAATLLYPKLTLFSIILLIGSSNFSSLHFKSLCAAVLGWVLPYWLLMTLSIWFQDLQLFLEPFQALATFEPLWGQWDIWQICICALLALLFIVSSLHSLSTNLDDKMRTRVFLHFFMLLCVCLLILLALQPSEALNLLPLTISVVSLIAGHYFALTGGRISAVFTGFILLSLVSTYLISLWTLS